MSTIDLSQYGITGAQVIHNPSWDQLFIDETKPGLEGYEKGQETELGAVNVMTGVYTGRSPKDKFFVKDDTSKDTIWWTSDEYKNDNKAITPATWDALKAIADKELSDKTLYVVDAFCGTNADTRMAVRFVMEVAWQAHFVTNMFIRPTEEELKELSPTSWCSTHPRPRLKTGRSSASTPRPALPSTSPSACSSSSTPGMVAR